MSGTSRLHPSSPRPVLPAGSASPRRAACGRPTLLTTVGALAACLAATPAAAQRDAGEFVLLHRGTEVLALRFAPSDGGGITGHVSSAGESVPFEGSLAGGTITFTTTSNGQVGEWSGALQGDRLTLTVRAPGGTERHVLTRRGTGWSDATPLARQWSARLAGRSIGRSSRTDGGSAGGAISESNVYLCPGGLAIVEENSMISISVPGGSDIPGMSGGRTSQSSDRARWRVITQGGVASIELSAAEGTFQLGVRQGSEPAIVVVAEQPLLLGGAGGKCDG